MLISMLYYSYYSTHYISLRIDLGISKNLLRQIIVWLYEVTVIDYCMAVRCIVQLQIEMSSCTLYVK